MHVLFQRANQLSHAAIGAAIEVHRLKGAGLLESIYENCLLLELKSVQTVLPIHKAQLLSYMKLLDIPVGLIINFHELKLANGVTRMILPGANR